MVKISYYKTNHELLNKSFCQLAQKCYYGKGNSYVIVDNIDVMKELDTVLWTYSQKHFIPHATISDPLPEKQPILISDSLEHINSANYSIVILVNPTKTKLISALLAVKESKYLQKILIISDDKQKINFAEIQNILLTCPLKCDTIECFAQNTSGQWQSINN